MLLRVIKTDYPIGQDGQYNITSAESCRYSFVALIESYYSLIWVDRYNECGEFELKVPATSSNIVNLKEDYYILASSISDRAMIIEKINLISDYEEGDYLLVSGRSLESVLDRRIIYDKLIFTGLDIARKTKSARSQDPSMVRNVVNTIIYNNFVSSLLNTKRRIFEFLDNILPSQTDISTADNSPFLSMNVTAEIQNSSCYDVIKNLCKDFGIGFKINLKQDVINSQTVIRFLVTLYYGLNLTTDLTQNQSGKVVNFSEVFNNLESSEYALETRDYKNYVKIDGIYHEKNGNEETEVPITTEVVGSFYNKNNVLNEATNIFRRETYLDASDISDKINANIATSYHPTGGLFIALVSNSDLFLSKINYSSIAHFTYVTSRTAWHYEEKNIYATTQELMQQYGLTITTPGTEIGDGSTIICTVTYDGQTESLIDQDAFVNRLKNEGNGVLIEKDIFEDFTAEVLPNVTYRYGEDYSLGDVVSFTTKYGVIYNCRITEVTFSDDENGFQVIPSFSVESSNLNKLES